MSDSAPPLVSDSCCLFWNLGAKSLSLSYRTFHACLAPAATVIRAPSGPVQFNVASCRTQAEAAFVGQDSASAVPATFSPVWPQSDHPSCHVCAVSLLMCPGHCCTSVHLLSAFLSPLGGTVYPCGFWWEKIVSGQGLMKTFLETDLFLPVSFCHLH